MRYSDYKPFLSPALSKATELVIESGLGAYLTDVNGDRYLDFVQGIAVNALGHCHPRIVAAIRGQAEKLINASFNLVSYPSTLEYAKRIAGMAPEGLDCVFFSNGGAEANDGALKLARAATRRPLIIAFRGAFHGRSYGAASITSSSSKYRKHYEPMVGGVHFAPYPTPYRWGPRDLTVDPESCGEEAMLEVRKLLDHVAHPDDVAAFIIEPILGEGGYVEPPANFLRGLREVCDSHGILLIMDEIQSGYGRTGKMFASEHFGVVPDIMTVGKAMAGGLPMSAIISSKGLMDKWAAGSHGTTFGGHPVAAAAGMALLDVFEEEGVLSNVVAQGGYLKRRLAESRERHPAIGDIRGLGLMVGMEFVHPDDKSPAPEIFNDVKNYCFKRKMLVLGCGVHGNGFRFATPLNVTREVLDEGLEILEDALKACC